MKEQMDGHKSGQTNSSPSMKVNQQNSKKKGVTFNAMETFQKQGDSIDKLISLMNELSSKLDKRDNPPQCKPRIHPGRNRGCGQRQSRYNSRDRSYSRDRGPYNNNNRNRRNYQNHNHYGLGNYRNRSRDSQNNRSYHRRQHSSQRYDQRFRHRSISRECDRSRPRYRSTLKENFENRYRNNQSRSRERQRSRTTSRERDTRSRSRSISQVSTNRDRLRCYRCNECDHFARECPNIMSDEEHIESLQMLLPEEQAMVLNYSETKDDATFLPLSIKGGPYISHNNKHVNPSGEKTAKFTHKRANNGIEIDRYYSYEAINGIEKNKIHSPETNNGIEMNKNYSHNEMTTDLMINPHKRVILKEPIKTKDQVPMEDWSILSDHVKYVTHGKSDTFQKLSINFMHYRQNRNLYKSLNNDQTIKTNLNFGNSPENLKTEYLDMYEGVYVEVINTDKFDADTDTSTTYLGKVDMTRDTE